jgi:hypothetical protein
VPGTRTERTPEADLPDTFEHRDHRRIGDADRADDQCDPGQ